MLEELHIENYALIDNITVRFTKGFNILSGETGAGKSILVGALGLLLGLKGDTGSIRTGCEETIVTGVVRVDEDEEVLSWLKERDIEPEDETVIIKRVLKRSGRGSAYIQSQPVTRGDLNNFTSLLFDMHGQHEHQSLLNVDNHRKLLDRYGGSEELAQQLYNEFQKLSALKKRYEEAASAERERLREMDILSYSIKEIDEANLKENEEEELEKERKILMEGERLFGLLDTVYESISESRGGALAQLREARSALEGVASINPEFSEHLKRIEESFFEIEDVVESVRKYRLEVDFSPERLEECERRLVTIRALEKKYGDSIKEVLSYRWDAEERLKCLGNWEEEKEKLEMEIQRLERRVFSLAGELSRGRKLAATDLEKNIQEKLKDLGMAKPVFKVEIKRRESEKGKPKCNQYGIDWIEFTISPNVGEPPKPLREIASGGEISRIMLAIKSVLAESDRIKSLIFDEIDVGIGGEVAVSVGEHLKKLSLHKQVLCITHLASIAVRADKHIKVEKSILNGRTITSVCPVDGRMRVEEIARMLSGDRRGEASLTHAEELLKRYGSPEGEYSGQNKQ